MTRTLATWSFPLLLTACHTPDADPARPLSTQLEEAAVQFCTRVQNEGVAAQSCFALFIPEGAINRRHLLSFHAGCESALRKASTLTSLQFNASADRAFFLSRVTAPGWEVPGGHAEPGAVLAREFRNGTELGWTALHAYWAQLNRLLIGDATWIQGLPESLRADLAHPLRYVVRVTAPLESNPAVTSYVHRLTMELVEVGKERSVCTDHFTLVLTHPLP